MPIATTYTIRPTQGTPIFTIRVGTAVGPVNPTPGVTDDPETDLTFYGYGRTGWGQEVDQNFYKLLENFACEENPAAAGTPKNSTLLGGTNGINKPVKGQLWFNTRTGSTTQDELFVCSNAGANTWKHLVSETYADSKYLSITGANGYLKLDGSNSPMTGYLTLNAVPTASLHAATKGYVDTSVSDALVTVGNTYVALAGDTMTGALSVKPTPTGHYTTVNNGNIELGNINGTVTTPFIDFHSSGGSIDYDSRIIASGGGVVGQGTLTLVGYALVDRNPTQAMQIANKAWVDTSITNAINGLNGSIGSLYVKRAGDTMTGQLNMTGNRIVNIAYPVSTTEPARVDWVSNTFYAPAGLGAARSIYISGAGPSGGVDGDIWFQL